MTTSIIKPLLAAIAAELAAGFGVQVGLFLYLRAPVHGARNQGVVLATLGTTSTAAMLYVQA
ncbi:MAG: hypothetical protein IH604_11925 [Burkholderiales bacterium]|nr:hypothetical protein [Burkholderiales bacterium]